MVELNIRQSRREQLFGLVVLCANLSIQKAKRCSWTTLNTSSTSTHPTIIAPTRDSGSGQSSGANRRIDRANQNWGLKRQAHAVDDLLRIGRTWSSVLWAGILNPVWTTYAQSAARSGCSPGWRLRSSACHCGVELRCAAEVDGLFTDHGVKAGVKRVLVLGPL